jgi:hypothetical protein
MALELANYEQKARESVKAFWGNRAAARQKQMEAGIVDQGERASVTGGKNMDGFVALVMDLIAANGLPNAKVQKVRQALTLPGFFRPTKLWDLLVLNEGRLVGALEFKSQVGPSFGKNFNNRAEEAIGTAVDFWTAFREGAFGDNPRPFVGWLMLVEDAPKSRSPVSDASPNFKVIPEFRNASYADRYRILCDKLVKENLYTAASVLLSPRTGVTDGAFICLDKTTSLKTFVTTFAGHVAAEAARASK